jgi:hypothetical protein
MMVENNKEKKNKIKSYLAKFGVNFNFNSYWNSMYFFHYFERFHPFYDQTKGIGVMFSLVCRYF